MPICWSLVSQGRLRNSILAYLRVERPQTQTEHSSRLALRLASTQRRDDELLFHLCERRADRNGSNQLLLIVRIIRRSRALGA